MLIKEYRIPLPLTAEEYQIAQLFMIQKKSRLESSGVGSGVEIIKNEPYIDGPNGDSGQYTFKIYHIGNRIPVWIRNILPSSALEAHEESWNSYPYTRTRYSCPLISHFSVEVETKYLNDSGNSENVFNLSQDELKNRVIDVIDFVRDPISSHDYLAEEDPKIFKSIKTGRGPLNECWIENCISNKLPLMCAYKLCKVEFKYWGLQTRGERWIHELALRQLSCSNSVSDIFFDCSDKFEEREEEEGQQGRTTLVRWSSELLLNEDDGEKSPPRTPRPSNNRFLLILVFHGDLFPTKSADSKITDTNTLRSTLESLISCHYSQLKGRINVQKTQQQRRGCSPSPSVATVDKQSNKAALASRQASTNSSQEPSHFALARKTTEVSSDVLDFHPTAAFLLGCPLALLLTQRQLLDEHQNFALACDQLYNLFYPLDLCGARLEPVLNPNLAQLPAPKVPRYQRFHLLGDGNDIHFDAAGSATPMVWGSRRVDHELYCPPEMNTLPALALPNILHVSYWESKDVGAFILRTFLRFDDTPGLSTTNIKNLADFPPLNFQMPLIVADAEEQIVNARFCYGPMDLVALSQENVLVYVLPSGGEWTLRGMETTDKHGRLSIDLGKSLPVDTFLSVSIAVVLKGTPIVVFSIDGSLTASVSVTGRDPRLKPGAVDVGYLIIYLTARPDMQQRLVSAWLATHNFPHGLLFFTPSLSTEPLKQKMLFMKHLTDIGLCVQAAYGSTKDIPVYSNAGLDPERIFRVGGGHRRKHTLDCVSLENGYSPHLHDLHSGKFRTYLFDYPLSNL
uniref:DDHD domain-containing protein n=1 Tax=Meloidogyne javanica TaxID=6303 RepID=A0A915NAQ6_MELJA